MVAVWIQSVSSASPATPWTIERSAPENRGSAVQAYLAITMVTGGRLGPSLRERGGVVEVAGVEPGGKAVHVIGVGVDGLSVCPLGGQGAVGLFCRWRSAYCED